MRSRWLIIGKLGDVRKVGNVWSVNIAENRYKDGVKLATIWYNCISHFEPKIPVGSVVMAHGHFDPSRSEGFKYAMVVEHIGIISNRDTTEG